MKILNLYAGIGGKMIIILVTKEPF